MLFCMCDRAFTTVSSPDRVSGWLGIMVGADLWYPLWGEDDAGSTAPALVVKLVDAPPPVSSERGVLTSTEDARGGGNEAAIQGKETQASSSMPGVDQGGAGGGGDAAVRRGAGELERWLGGHDLGDFAHLFARAGVFTLNTVSPPNFCAAFAIEIFPGCCDDCW